MNQIERHPFLQQAPLLEFCLKHHIFVTGYSPLGRADTTLLEHPTLCAIAKTHHCTPAQIALRWGVHQEGTAVIPKSSHLVRLKENLAAIDLTLSTEDMQSLAALNKEHRYIQGSHWFVKDGPYTFEQLWN